MKSLQRLCAAIALILVLNLSVSAGDMSTGVGYVPPPPPPSAAMMGGGMETMLNTGEASDEATSLSPVAEIGLSLLQSVLALF